MSPKLFIFGLGFCGRSIAQRMLAEGWRVAATIRPGADKGATGPLEDVELHRFDRGAPLDPTTLEGVTHLLSTVPPDEAGDPVLAWLEPYSGRLTDLDWAGYLSTTGVYGDRNGAWVDESAETRPNSQRSRRRVEAEKGWLSSGLPVHVFRLAGIYGPGRSAFETVRAGQARRIVKPGQVFGRIHVDDVAKVVKASMARPRPGAIYNLADDEPAPPQDVITYACGLLGVDPPPELPWEQAQSSLSPMARSFYADSKRVANGLIKTELGVDLTYPSYREGLRAILDASPSQDRREAPGRDRSGR